MIQNKETSNLSVDMCLNYAVVGGINSLKACQFTHIYKILSVVGKRSPFLSFVLRLLHCVQHSCCVLLTCFVSLQ